MTLTFGDVALETLWLTGHSKGISTDLQKRALRALTALAQAGSLRDVPPSFRTHPLVGTKPLRHSMWVGGAWRITFIVHDDTLVDVRLVQYH
jgi:plasmid maintenance system killer protein